jgi:UDP-N-acetylglucosamine 2-epimerase (non-hydrolysing)
MAARYRVLIVAGARPNFVKIAPIAAELARFSGEFEQTLVHTGQHYDEKLSRVFFEELSIPRPDVNLEVGSGSHAQQTAAVMAAFEPVLIERRPDLVMVVGDVNSTIACALVACKLGIRIAHVEAGLRSYDRTMPEEINRVLTDQISDLLFTTEEAAAGNLQREGIDLSRVHFVGNVMIDSLLAHRARARQLHAAARLSLVPNAYGLLTLHRPSNVDDPAMLDRLFEGIGTIAREVPIIFPVHPRTRGILPRSARAGTLIDSGQLRIVEPLGYLDFLSLMDSSRVVLTDSGGVQEETTVLGVPCLTLRENTERPITITEGTNTLVGTDPARISAAWRTISDRDGPAVETRTPPMWDGRAAERLVGILRRLSVPDDVRNRLETQ